MRYIEVEKKAVNFHINVEERAFGFRLRVYYNSVNPSTKFIGRSDECIGCPGPSGLVLMLISLPRFPHHLLLESVSGWR